MECPMCGEQVAPGEFLCECGYALGPAVHARGGGAQQSVGTEESLRPSPRFPDQVVIDPDEEVFQKVLKQGFWKSSREERGTYSNLMWKKMSGFSKTTVILGIMSGFLPVLALFAVPMGAVVLVRSRNQPEYRTGRGLVLLSMVVALIPFALLSALLLAGAVGL